MLNSNKKEHTIWAEKYRPKSVDEYIGNDHVKKKVKQYIEDKDPPHLLLYGRAGTGKTTLGKIIINGIDAEYLYINASDETSVEIIRTKVKNFASAMGFGDIKIVLLDEFDYMTPNAQAALRNLMETFSKTTRFILTCNYHEKIIEPIVSRCQTFHIVPPNKKDVAVHMSQILDKEKVEYDIKDVALLVNSNYPDIRRLINAAQNHSNNNKLKIDQDSLIESDFKLKLLELLKSDKDKKETFKQSRQLLADNQVSDFSEVFRLLYDNIDDYAEGNVANVILILSEGQYYDALVVDKEINFMSVLIKIINEIK